MGISKVKVEKNSWFAKWRSFWRFFSDLPQYAWKFYLCVYYFHPVLSIKCSYTQDQKLPRESTSALRCNSTHTGPFPMWWFSLKIDFLRNKTPKGSHFSTFFTYSCYFGRPRPKCRSPENIDIEKTCERLQICSSVQIHTSHNTLNLPIFSKNQVFWKISKELMNQLFSIISLILRHSSSNQVGPRSERSKSVARESKFAIGCSPTLPGRTLNPLSASFFREFIFYYKTSRHSRWIKLHPGSERSVNLVRETKFMFGCNPIFPKIHF